MPSIVTPPNAPDYEPAMGRRDLNHIAEMERALAELDAGAAVLTGIRCLTGIKNPLHLPTAADIVARRELAISLASWITTVCDLNKGPSYVTFVVRNSNWSSLAHHTRVPYRTMRLESVSKLKRCCNLEILWTPAIGLRHVKGVVRIEPQLNFFIFGYGLGDREAGFVDRVRRDFRGGQLTPIKPLTFRALTREKIASNTNRMLGLTPITSQESTRSHANSTTHIENQELLQLMVNATLPLTKLAGATGNAMKALSGAIKEWKASRNKWASRSLPQVKCTRC